MFVDNYVNGTWIQKSGTFRTVVEVQVNFGPFRGRLPQTAIWSLDSGSFDRGKKKLLPIKLTNSFGQKTFSSDEFPFENDCCGKRNCWPLAVKWSSVQNYFRSSYFLTNFISQKKNQCLDTKQLRQLRSISGKLPFWLNDYSVQWFSCNFLK
jgi:hypothetical protein